MNVSAITPPTHAESNKRALPAANSKEAGVIKQFESVMLSMMLKQMRQTASEDGMFPGDKSDTLGGMFDTYMGDHLAESGGIGLMRSFDGKVTSNPKGPNPSEALQQIRQQAIGAYTDAASHVSQ